MKNTFLILALGLCGRISADDLFLGMASSSDGQRLRWIVSEERVVNTPSWSGSFAEAGEKLDQFVAAARDYMRKRHPRCADPVVTAVYIQKVDRAGRKPQLKGKWFVTVSFGGTLARETEKGVRVLMDGTIVAPKSE